MARTARAMLAAVIGLAGVIAGAQPAAAHSTTGAEPTNYRSTIFSVSPSVPGVRIQLRDIGRQVQLVNNGGVDVVVLGYEGEPYLRVGRDGTFENRRSPTTYHNKTIPGGETGVDPPPEADARAPADWRKTGDGERLRWRDQRTQWDGPDPEDPGTKQVVGQWSIPMRHGDTPLTVSGVITWFPPPSAAPWLLLALVLLLGTLGLAMRRNWQAGLAVALATVVAVDIVHTFASAASSGDAIAVMVLKVLVGNLPATLAWIGGGWAVAALRRGNDFGAVVAALCGLILGIYAIGETAVFSRSQLPYAFPAVTDRMAVAIALGAGFGLVLAAVVVFRRNPSLITRAADVPDADGA